MLVVFGSRLQSVARLQGLWRHPDFIRLWAGQTVSLLGSSVSDLAIPLLAVITLNATAPQMGVLQAVGRLPYLLFALVIGAWVDRVRRRGVLIWTDLARAGLTLLIPVSAWLGFLSMPALWLIALLVATAGVFFELAYRAYLPILVGRDQMVEANSRMQISSSTASIVGPGLGGLLVQLLTAPIAVLVDAISFLVSAFSLALIKGRESDQKATTRRSLAAEIREGLGFQWRHPILRVFMAMTGTFNLFVTMSAAVTILFLVRELRLTPVQIGIVFGAGSTGGLSGAALATRFNRSLGVGPTMVVARVLMQLGLLAVPAAFGPLLLVLPLLALGGVLFGLGVNVSNITQWSYRQVLTPDSLQGRVQAANLMIVFGVASPAGSVLGGWLGQLIGLRPTLWLGLAGTTLPLLMLLASPVVKLGQMESAAPAAGP